MRNISSVLWLLLLVSCATQPQQPEPPAVENPQVQENKSTSESAAAKPVPAGSPTPTAAPKEKHAVPVTPLHESTSKAPVLESKKAVLEEVEALYAAAKTIKADFEQIKEIASLGTKKQSSGVIRLKLPGSFRWEMNEPEKNVMVTNGETFWFYTPPFDEGENGQVLIKKNSEIHTRVASALLSGKFSSGNDFKIKKNSESEYTLFPKKGTAGDVLKARVWIDLKGKIIERVILEHKGGNRTDIALRNVVLGEKTSDSVFSFKIPPKTDVVKQ